MSSDHARTDAEVAIRLDGVGKRYRLYDKPAQRLWQALWPRSDAGVREFTALAPLDLEVRRGEALGIVGRNGAGKSTLLQLVCGTLTPSHGRVAVTGKIGALLELGAGFNPEFSGRENVFLAAAVMGLPKAQIAQLYDSIVAFSGIGEFIEQPVKTYSSGMYVRLAFAIATSVEPDILVIDEALSVGDGAFAKQSFERIMRLKERGTTVLFCSHSLYQVEAFCTRALWLERGEVRMIGPSAQVVAAYNDSLRAQGTAAPGQDAAAAPLAGSGVARITGVQVQVDGQPGTQLTAQSQHSEVTIRVAFASDPALPTPVVATGFTLPDGTIFSSVYTSFDKVPVPRDAQGNGAVTVRFPRIALMKGRFSVAAYLFDERAIHVHDRVLEAAGIEVTQPGIEQGFVHLPHEWVEPGAVD